MNVSVDVWLPAASAAWTTSWWTPPVAGVRLNASDAPSVSTDSVVLCPSASVTCHQIASTPPPSSTGAGQHELGRTGRHRRDDLRHGRQRALRCRLARRSPAASWRGDRVRLWR
ncbi:MAG: hypothetical protein R2856_33015 [Caldilineaceae bacterium]